MVDSSEKARSMGSRALLVSAGTMLSRVLGLVREQVFAALLGASMYTDAFNAAFTIPNLLRDLFAEGVLSAAFVPTFADYMKNRGRADAIRLANIVIGLILVVVGAIALIGIVAAPAIVSLVYPGFAETAGKAELTTTCTRIMFPFLPLVSVAAVVMGQLNAEERYGAPAIASAMFNVMAIVCGLVLKIGGFHGNAVAIGWSVGTLLGGAAQLLVQVPPLLKTGYRFRPALDWREPGVLRIVSLMAPALIGLAATQVNIVVNASFASQAGTGAVSYLRYAFRLMQLPIGVFGVAVATIATTRLARLAAERNAAGLGETFAQGLRLVAFLTIPSTAGLIALREPIIRLLYQHGLFNATDTTATGAVLVMYATGLYCYSAVKVAAPAFYAMNRTRVPMLGSILAVGANLALSFVLFPVLSYRGLALGTAAAATMNFLVLFVSFRALVPSLDVAGLALQFAKVLVAGAACGVVAWYVDGAVETWLGVDGAFARIAAVGAAIGVGGAVYALVCRLLRVKELDDIAGLLRRKRPSGTMPS